MRCRTGLRRGSNDKNGPRKPHSPHFTRLIASHSSIRHPLTVTIVSSQPNHQGGDSGNAGWASVSHLQLPRSGPPSRSLRRNLGFNHGLVTINPLQGPLRFACGRNHSGRLRLCGDRGHDQNTSGICRAGNGSRRKDRSRICPSSMLKLWPSALPPP